MGTGKLRFIAYLRVSTQQQGKSGLGLDAQREAVEKHIASVTGLLVGQFTEVESGKVASRPELAKALSACRAQKATLLVARLDRLARNTKFLLEVLEGIGPAGICFCDLPQLPAGPVGRLLVSLLASVAELEAGLISARTKAALAQAKLRGVKLGNPHLKPGNKAMALAANAVQQRLADARAQDVQPFIQQAQQAGAVSLGQLAQALNARGIPSARGGTWSANSVARTVERLERLNTMAIAA
jgi:DNA invertase Pin-like site-specific DNA recombinase